MSNTWHGERILLRAIEPEDWPLFRSEGIEFLDDARLYDDRIPAPSSEQQARERMERRAQGSPDSDNRTLAVVTRTGELAGSTSTDRCDRPAGTFEFGFGIFQSHRRRGYASEAVCILLRYYFEELRYEKANSVVYSFNEPSLALHRRLGFVEEGRRRSNGFTAGRRHDDVLFGMTVEEFHDQFGPAGPPIPPS
jgi:RimJ/RimL family protein N-acetyltransferase